MEKLLKILFLTVLIEINPACITNYNCLGFDLKSPLISLSLSPQMSDSIQFESENNETLSLFKIGQNYIKPYIEKCGFGDIKPCHCEQFYFLSYRVAKSNEILQVYINSFKDNYDTTSQTISYAYRSFLSNPTKPDQNLISKFYSINYKSIENSIDSLLTTYNSEKILELVDTTQNTGVVKKVWIKPTIGLIKIWRNEKCWTLKQI